MNQKKFATSVDGEADPRSIFAIFTIVFLNNTE